MNYAEIHMARDAVGTLNRPTLAASHTQHRVSSSYQSNIMYVDIGVLVQLRYHISRHILVAWTRAAAEEC